MKIAFFDTHQFERSLYENVNENFGHSITYFETRLTEQTANLAAQYPCVCAFVNDRLDSGTLKSISASGTRLSL